MAKRDLRFAVILHDGETWASIQEACDVVLVDMDRACPKGEGCLDADDAEFQDAIVARWNLWWLLKDRLSVLVGVKGLSEVEEIEVEELKQYYSGWGVEESSDDGAN